MSTKKRVTLGKGLEALLGARVTPEQAVSNLIETTNRLLELPIDQIRPGRYQPRLLLEESELQPLADSIRAQGVIQPISVNRLGVEEYEIIAGERRWRAAQLAGLQTIPALVKDVSAQAATAMALIENIQREDLTPLEEARALERLAQEFQLTHQQVAEAVGKSRSAVSNLLRLLTLPERIHRFLDQKLLEMGHAKILVGLKESEQLRVADLMVAQGLSVRESEALLAELAGRSTAKKAGVPIDLSSINTENTASKAPLDPDIQRLVQTLSEKLGARVELVHQATGKGRLLIHYHSLEVLDGILAHIQ